MNIYTIFLKDVPSWWKDHIPCLFYASIFIVFIYCNNVFNIVMSKIYYYPHYWLFLFVSQFLSVYLLVCLLLTPLLISEKLSTLRVVILSNYFITFTVHSEHPLCFGWLFSWNHYLYTPAHNTPHPLFVWYTVLPKRGDWDLSCWLNWYSRVANTLSCILLYYSAYYFWFWAVLDNFS